MTVGYIITAHALPDHLIRLVRRLRGGGARFFVHVDARSPHEVMRVIEQGIGGDDDVVLLPRHRCHWASFALVEAALKGVRALLADPAGFDYGVLLTGQDYPLRPPAAIARHLESSGGRSFMTARVSTGRFLDRTQHWHWHSTVRGRPVKVPNRMVPIRIRRPLPTGLTAYDGSAHWCLSRGCLEHVVRTIDERPDVLRFFRRASVADESFFQTLVMNSPLAGTIVDDHLRFMDWPEHLDSPKILTVAHLDAMLASNALFARKFDPRIDAAVLDALDAHLDRRGALP